MAKCSAKTIRKVARHLLGDEERACLIQSLRHIEWEDAPQYSDTTTTFLSGLVTALVVMEAEADPRDGDYESMAMRLIAAIKADA